MSDRINSIHDLIKDRLKVNVTFRVNPIVSVIGTTSTMIARRDVKRLAIVITNLSSNDMYIMPDAAASPSSGIYLAPSGGSVTFYYNEDFILPACEWYAVASAVSSNIMVIETCLV